MTNSALARILQKPNDYQTPSDFLLNLTHSLYREGNAFALALRNHRYEIDELHLMNARVSAPLVAVDGSIFFRLSGNAVVDKLLGDTQLIVPQRECYISNCTAVITGRILSSVKRHCSPQ